MGELVCEDKRKMKILKISTCLLFVLAITTGTFSQDIKYYSMKTAPTPVKTFIAKLRKFVKAKDKEAIKLLIPMEGPGSFYRFTISFDDEQVMDEPQSYDGLFKNWKRRDNFGWKKLERILTTGTISEYRFSSGVVYSVFLEEGTSSNENLQVELMLKKGKIRWISFEIPTGH